MASFSPEFDHTQEVTVDAVVWNVLLNVSITKVTVETFLSYCIKPLESLFIHNQLLNIILTVDMLKINCSI